MDQLIIDGKTGLFPVRAYSSLAKPEGLQVSVEMARTGEIYGSGFLVANLILIVQSTGLDEWLKSKAWDVIATYIATLYISTIPNRPRTKGSLTFREGKASFHLEVEDITQLPEIDIRLRSFKEGGIEKKELVISTKQIAKK